jgi:hypothetical protein
VSARRAILALAAGCALLGLGAIGGRAPRHPGTLPDREEMRRGDRALDVGRDRQAPPAAPAQPLPLARSSDAARSRVPAGILGRAADARALERHPPCRRDAKAKDAGQCRPGGNESIDVEWNVAGEP